MCYPFDLGIIFGPSLGLCKKYCFLCILFKHWFYYIFLHIPHIIFCMVSLKKKAQNNSLISGKISFMPDPSSKWGCQCIINIRTILTNVWIWIPRLAQTMVRLHLFYLIWGRKNLFVLRLMNNYWYNLS